MGARAGSDPSLSLCESRDMMALEGLGRAWNCSVGSMKPAVCRRVMVPAHGWLRALQEQVGLETVCSACVVVAVGGRAGGVGTGNVCEHGTPGLTGHR